jgi:hypothetical protein
MKRCTVIVLALSLVLVAGSAAAAQPIIGRWQAKSLQRSGETKPLPEGTKITIEFVKGGDFIATMEGKDRQGKARRKDEKGKWTVEGDTLTTTGKKTEKFTFKVEGDSLTLLKEERGEKMLLKRVK